MSEPLHKRIADNFGRACDNPSCQKVRDRVGRHCKLCNLAFIRHGTPTGRAIKPKEYAVESRMVRDFLAAHRDHLGVRNALAFMQSLLPSDSGDPVLGVPVLSAGTTATLRPHFSRLAGHGITPLEVLEKCAALWLLHSWEATRLDDGLPLTLALGNGILSMAPRPQITGTPASNRVPQRQAPRPRIRKLLGLTIREVLGPLLGNISRAIMQVEATRETFKDSMRTAFSSSESAFSSSE